MARDGAGSGGRERRNFLAALRVKPTWALLEEKSERTGFVVMGEGRGGLVANLSRTNPVHVSLLAQEGRTRTCQPAASCCAGQQQ